MTFSLADLRKSRGQDLTSITKALQKMSDGGQKDDEADFFKLQKDKAGNASAVIRFLPKHPDDELPWVQLYSHGFQGPSGRWYIENSRTTLGESDPVSEENRKLWSTGLESDKELARKQKRKLNYIANILVVSCPTQPELEGKTMRFKFGKKIFEKIMDKIQPTFEDEAPVNVFDAFEGADLKLRMRQVEGYPNYDTSVFSEPKPIDHDEERILEVLNSMKPLKEFVDPAKFKSYDELKKKYNQVMTGSTGDAATAEAAVEAMIQEPKKTPKAEKVVESKVKTAPKSAPAEEDEDIEEYFKKLTE